MRASTHVTARCAPLTSLFSLLTSEPVCVRVKNASGYRCTCRNTLTRSSLNDPLTNPDRIPRSHIHRERVSQRQPGDDQGQASDDFQPPRQNTVIDNVPEQQRVQRLLRPNPLR